MFTKGRGKGMIVQSIIGSLFLGICSIIDIKTQKIYLNVCFIFMILGVWLNGISGIMIRILPGIFIGILAWLTRESIGYGDGLVFVVMGIVYGVKVLINICGISFLVLAMYCICMLFTGKKNRKDKVPLSPFLFIGNICMIVFGG